MNFAFLVTVHGFEKAAKVEKMLKEMGITFECNMLKPVSSAKVRRPRLDKASVAAVTLAINSNPDLDDKGIARITQVGRNTVNRIRRGIHPLQADEIAPKNQLRQLGG